MWRRVGSSTWARWGGTGKGGAAGTAAAFPFTPFFDPFVICFIANPVRQDKSAYNSQVPAVMGVDSYSGRENIREKFGRLPIRGLIVLSSPLGLLE
jgi:hypothetical protein